MKYFFIIICLFFNTKIIAQKNNIYSNDDLSFSTLIYPKKDSLNSKLEINWTKKNIEDFEILIYNRWGQNIFSSKNAYFSWQGINKNKRIESGTYFFIIKYKLLSKSNILKGNIGILE